MLYPILFVLDVQALVAIFIGLVWLFLKDVNRRQFALATRVMMLVSCSLVLVGTADEVVHMQSASILIVVLIHVSLALLILSRAIFGDRKLPVQRSTKGEVYE